MKALNKINAFLLLLSLLAVFAAPAIAETSEGEGIEFFEGSWQDVLDNAKKSKKLIFVDAYTVWCGPCKMMTRNVFTDPGVGKFYNENFVNYKFDMEKGEGPEFAAKYSVTAYPTLLYLNYKGDVVHKVLGYRPPQTFLQEGKTALDPSKNQVMLEDEFDAGTTDPEILYEYAMKQYKANEDYSDAANRFFATQKKKQLRSKRGWQAINMFTKDIDSPEFAYLLKKRKKYKKLYGEKEVNEKISTVCKYNAAKAVKDNDQISYDMAVGIARKYLDDDGKTALELELIRAKSNENWKTYGELMSRYMDKFTITDPDQLNSIAWNFYLHVEDADLLEKAAGWARQSVALKSEYYNNDTYAALLFKTGKYEEAKKYANKAIYLAEKEEVDATDTRDLLKKIEAAMD